MLFFRLFLVFEILRNVFHLSHDKLLCFGIFENKSLMIRFLLVSCYDSAIIVLLLSVRGIFRYIFRCVSSLN